MIGASVSVQRISTSTMKALGVISLFVTYVAARGSGPYLPSGWKPDGPAFYLPSEVSKPSIEPVKEVIFSESEASGSDFLREYGPPKVQEVSQDISQQGLPDVVNDQLFKETVVDTISARENSNVATEISEQKLEVNSEVKAAEEALTITESSLITATESITNIEVETVQVNDETTTLSNDIDSIKAVDEFGYIVEPTVAIVVPTEKVTIEESVQSENQILGNTIVETNQLISQQQDSDQLVRQVEESVVIDTIQDKSGTEQPSNDVSEQAEPSTVESSGASATQQTDINFDVISTVEENVKPVEEVKNDDKIVQNIPEQIASLENEVKSQQAEAIPEVPAAVQGIARSLEEAPEGFLEYGPPGFREYGPPNGVLRDNTIEEKIPEPQSIENSEIRKRRFSPKFRPSPKQR